MHTKIFLYLVILTTMLYSYQSKPLSEEDKKKLKDKLKQKQAECGDKGSYDVKILALKLVRAKPCGKGIT